VDSVDILNEPLTRLFSLIYYQRNVTQQWLIAKTIPVYKNKGEKNSIEYYPPIANLCSTSKIFEKLVLKRINELQTESGCDRTGEG
jgi:hypothetical protein